MWLSRALVVMTVFVLAAGRSHDVAEALLGADAQGILNVDRCSAYPAMQQVQDGHITLALCWAHQRRDFIEAENFVISFEARPPRDGMPASTSLGAARSRMWWTRGCQAC